MDNRPNIFDYQDVRAFLVDFLKYKQSRHPMFSGRAWANQMGFRSAAALSFFMSGQRLIRSQHIAPLLRGLDLDAVEREYFELLVLSQSSNSEYERSMFSARLKELRSGAPRNMPRIVSQGRQEDESLLLMDEPLTLDEAGKQGLAELARKFRLESQKLQGSEGRSYQVRIRLDATQGAIDLCSEENVSDTASVV